MKALCGPQVVALDTEPFSRLVVRVVLNGREVDALVDTGCGRTLVKSATGPHVPEAEIHPRGCEGLSHQAGPPAGFQEAISLYHGHGTTTRLPGPIRKRLPGAQLLWRSPTTPVDEKPLKHSFRPY